MKQILCIGALLLFAACTENTALERDRHVSKLAQYDSKAQKIVSRMPLEEKVAMMHGKFMFVSEGVPSQGIAQMAYADGPFGIREELESKSWNPLHLTTDSATFFPTGSALAATWSEELAYEYGTGMAREARLRGKDMILGPAINIQRIPVGGRTYEYLSEDPFLSSRLTVGYTLGVQDNGVAACIKHFALNNQESNRGSVNVIVSPRAMREIYLPPFEAAVVEADAYGVMAAYNKINGYWCAENHTLLTEILRREWGFKGMVISDWGGTHSTVGSVTAGLNVEMPDAGFLGQALIDSVRSGAIAESVVDERVREILRVRLAVEPVPDDQANVEMTAKPEQAEIAYKVAAGSIVLLKNEGDILPLNCSGKRVAVIGDNATKRMSQGGVGAGVKALYEVTPLEGLQNRLPKDTEILYAQGYTASRASRGGFWGMRTQQPADDHTAEKLFKEAVDVAREAHVVLFMGGTNRDWETEGSDRTSLQLPYDQVKLFNAIAEVNPNVVLVLVAGAPLDLREVEPKAAAILQSWFNGTEGGNALADILVGNVSPSGRLPFTYPLRLEDSPAYALGNYPQTGAEIEQDVFVALVGNQTDVRRGSDNRSTALYSEDLLVGYRWFDTKGVPVLYPFGYGLTYSKFDYSDMKTDKSAYSEKESITVTLNLKNSGKVKAAEVVQLYVHRLDGEVEWPYKELKAFQKVTLEPGKEEIVTLEVPVESLKYWDENRHDWALEHGRVELLLGASAGEILLKSVVNI